MRTIRDHIAAIMPMFRRDVKFKRPGFTSLKAAMKEDVTLHAVFLYRIAHQVFLEDPNNKILPVLANLMRVKTGVEIYYSNTIGVPMQIQHGVGIVIGPRNHIGNSFIIHQGATIGQKHLGGSDECLTIGNNVTLFAGACVFANIGDNVQLGANAVLLKRAESNSVYVGVPARRVKRGNFQNGSL